LNPRAIQIKDLAAELGRPVEGDGDLQVDGVAPLERAGDRDLSFVRSPEFAELLSHSRAAAVIAPNGIDVGDRPVIRSDHPGLDFARATRRLLPAPQIAAGVAAGADVGDEARVHSTASVAVGAVVGAASVGARTVIHSGVVVYDDVILGEDCVVHAGCVLREGTRLGDRVILQPGVVLGGDGFGYVAGARGPEKVPQVGGVAVGDDVEIGANSTVDRGTLGDTVIGRGTKIDNLVQVGHNCRVGEEVVIVSQAGLSGSTTVEDRAIVMAQAGITGHVTVGERAVVGPQAGVLRDVPPHTRVLGSPQREERLQKKIAAALPRLPELLRRVRALERRLRGSDASDGPGADGD
jgi:UDP-3-O-[3-hydroxymyristoyl] glucosamine N-acyltransferase